MILTEEQIKKLNSLCGTGDHLNADILFFGNEEGFGGDSINHVIEERMRLFESNEPLINNDKLKGHFYIDRTTKAYPASSPFLNFSSRLMLALQFPNGNWFTKMSEDSSAADKIREYQAYKLYREKTGYKSGLFELRPLPRANESTWPYSSENNLQESEYNKAFSFIPSIVPNKYHQDLRNGRLSILKNLFENTSAKYFIGVGAKDFKKRALQYIYPDIKFRDETIGRVRCHIATRIINERSVKIILCPFFGYGRKGLTDLNALQDLVKEIRLN